MTTLIVVNNPKDWPLSVPGAEVIPARSYLTEAKYSELEDCRVLNLCRSYRYQTLGYYVSLLAEARDHRPMPGISTVQDLKSPSVVQLAAEELEEQISRALAPIQSDGFTLSIYFGRNLAKRYDRLSSSLFKIFNAPFLRAEFARGEGREWRLMRLKPIGAKDIPPEHHDFVVEAAGQYLARRRSSTRQLGQSGYHLAILHDPQERTAPSDEKALQRFGRAAERLGMNVEFIGRDDYMRLAEFDALFIRETTAVNHHTYRFARRAAAEGLVVIDDPHSILRCSNKVYLAELMSHNGIATPRTMIVHRDNADQVAREVGFPCILKQPDSAFSLGVVKIETQEALAAKIEEMMEDSELLIAQEFYPTEYDWRIGVLDRKPLYACRYYMASEHWQIVKVDSRGERNYGKVEAIPLDLVPANVLRTGVRAANLIGDGLYGVDLKQSGREVCLIEVNDNPNLDSGVEDRILHDELYRRVMEVFLRRIERMKRDTGRR